jgi:hypothetical protein
MGISPSPTPRASVIGGRYTVLRKLGSGSLGSVYLARDEKARRPVALKIIRSGRTAAQAVRPMQDEFRAIAGFTHPRIARAYDFGYTEAGVPYYTRESIGGAPLPPGPPGKESPSKFLRPVPALDPEAAALLAGLPWPGNVRGLEMFLLGLLVKLPESGRITARDMEAAMAGAERAPVRPDLLSRGLDEHRKELEREYLKQLFRKVRGDMPVMCRELGVKSTKLYTWLRGLGLDIREPRRGISRTDPETR